MKKIALLSTLLICFGITSQAQTKRIKHRSHSGTSISFHLDYLDNLGWNPEWNKPIVIENPTLLVDSMTLIMPTVTADSLPQKLELRPSTEGDRDWFLVDPNDTLQPQESAPDQPENITPEKPIKPMKPKKRKVRLASSTVGPQTIKDQPKPNGNTSLIILLSIPASLLFLGTVKRIF